MSVQMSYGWSSVNNDDKFNQKTGTIEQNKKFLAKTWQPETFFEC